MHAVGGKEGASRAVTGYHVGGGGWDGGGKKKWRENIEGG